MKMIGKNNVKTMIIPKAITIFLVLTCSAWRAEANSCLSLTTCATCTEFNACRWSADLQSCWPTIATTPGNLTIARPSDCPLITVVNRAVEGLEEFVYRLNVTNDKIGFAAYLDDAKNLICVWESDVRSPGTLMYDHNNAAMIVCDPVRRTRFRNIKLPFVRRFHVTFGSKNVSLRMDQDADYYTTFYNSMCGPTRDDDCVDCMFTDSEKRYYLKSCSARNLCAVKPSMKFVYVNSHRLKNSNDNSSSIQLPWPPALMVNCERAIAVPRFRPSWALWTAERVTMWIDVKNLAVLVERWYLMEVTVAGRQCVDVKMQLSENESGGRISDQLMCTVVSAPDRRMPARGPVVVRFASMQAGSWVSFVVGSRDEFLFYGPRVTGARGDQCGSVRGGAIVTIDGTALEKSADARPYVASVPCAPVRRDAEKMTCVTGPSASPTPRGRPGPVSVVFDGGLVLHAPGPGFAYVADPRPTSAGDLVAIASGGNKVPVNWTDLTCVEHGTLRLYAERTDDGKRFYADCMIVNTELAVCDTPSVSTAWEAETSTDADGLTVKVRQPPVTFVERLNCGFQMQFAGQKYEVPCKAPMALYVYSDPVFVGYRITGPENTIVVMGHNVGRGYTAHDVFVTLPIKTDNNKSTECFVRPLGRGDTMECVPDVSVRHSSDLQLISEIWVKVGNAEPIVVKRLDPLPAGPKPVIKTLYINMHNQFRAPVES